MNLLDETSYILTKNGKTIDDIRWIGGDNFMISLCDFERLANVSYDNGYGAPKVALDLKIVGDDWWMERAEYDGSEWWEFITKPKAPKYCAYPTRLITDNIGWEYLDEMNNSK